MTVWAIFPRNGYISPTLISSGIATTTFHQYNHTGMLYFGCKLKITEKYKYVIFRKVKQSKLVITTWKLPSSKVYHGLNNALGICVHENHYQVLPTQMVPICENLGLGPWTISSVLCWEAINKKGWTQLYNKINGCESGGMDIKYIVFGYKTQACIRNNNARGGGGMVGAVGIRISDPKYPSATWSYVNNWVRSASHQSYGDDSNRHSISAGSVSLCSGRCFYHRNE